MWAKPEYSRQESDLINRTRKGWIGYEDLNRSEGNSQFLANLADISLTTKTWTRNDLPNETEYARIRDNVDTLRRNMQYFATTPKTPPNPLNAYGRWNDLEKILFDLYLKQMQVISSYNYTGEIYAGEGIGVL